MYSIIRKKRDGKELTREEIQKFVTGYTNGQIPDYQAAALLMAICLNGMNERETADLTMGMAQSGESIDLSMLGDLSSDKHSSGGVGDKTTLIAIPIAATLGCKIAKMSGRGLGHTGGTIDKLESIPGYCTELPPEKFIEQTQKIGIALTAQSGNLAPADKKIYALRDVTATVDSIPLIASSIMSKKLASGAKNIVLDVKVGSGAFMKDIESARVLAKCMVAIGRNCGRNVRAILTNMDVPLGNCVGNSLEVIESVNVLKGSGDKNLLDISCILAAHMASMALNKPYEKMLEKAYEAVKSGAAYEKFLTWIKEQGGNIEHIENTDLFEKASKEIEVKSDKTGYISSIDAQEIGNICVEAGGGRKEKGDKIDYSAGIILLRQRGDWLEKGEVIAKIYTNKENITEKLQRDFLPAVEISDEIPEKKPLVYEVVE